MRIYLAGPISGCDFDECTDWREEFSAMMPNSVQCFSPMRGKEFLKLEGTIEGEYPKLGPLATSRGIMTRDFFDCTRCDIVLVNFLHSGDRVSIGTCMEIAWAYMGRTPLILVSEANNIHNHPMITEAIGYRVETLADAARVAIAVLCPQDIAKRAQAK